MNDVIYLMLSDDIVFADTNEIRKTDTVILKPPFHNDHFMLMQLQKRLASALASLKGSLGQLSVPAHYQSDENFVPLDGKRLQRLMLYSNLHLPSALAEFNNAIIASGLIYYVHNIAMNEKNWQNLSDYIKEEIFFSYIANFILKNIT